jgi:pimeloyl-ACP methyl ester carboxylesterase
MAVGMKDPVLGPPAMAYLARQVRGSPPLHEVAEGGHFLQEWGGEVARRALDVL